MRDFGSISLRVGIDAVRARFTFGEEDVAFLPVLGDCSCVGGTETERKATFFDGSFSVSFGGVLGGGGGCDGLPHTRVTIGGGTMITLNQVRRKVR